MLSALRQMEDMQLSLSKALLSQEDGVGNQYLNQVSAGAAQVQRSLSLLPLSQTATQRAMKFARAMTTGWVGITALYFCNIKAISVTVIALLGSLLFGAPPLKRLVNKLRGSAAGLAITEVFVLGLFVLALIFMINSTYSPFLYFQY